MKPINGETLPSMPTSNSPISLDTPRPDQSQDLMVLNAALESIGSDSVNLDFGDLYKSLTIASKEIVDKINELLKAKLPNGVQSLKPSEVTPEATADTIVQGVTSLFSTFARQNPKLAPDELVKGFIEQAKKGVEQGYGQAKQILGDLGALEYDGVESGISETRDLIMQKLDAFANQTLKELSGGTVSNAAAQVATEEVLTQGGSKTIDTQA